MRVLTNVHVRMAVQLVSGGDRVYVYEDYLMYVRPCGGNWTLTVVLRGNLPPRALLKSYVHALVRPLAWSPVESARDVFSAGRPLTACTRCISYTPPNCRTFDMGA